MLFFIYPGRDVPGWLEKVSFSGISKGCPSVKHAGFGFVVQRQEEYFVYMLCGTFIRVNGAGMGMKMVGGEKGVNIHFCRFHF